MPLGVLPRLPRREPGYIPIRVGRSKWEYLFLSTAVDPGADGWDTKLPQWWMWGPGDEKYKDAGTTPFAVLLNRLGSEGWELIGPPNAQKAVFTYKAANDTWHDRSYNVETTWVLKREIAG